MDYRRFQSQAQLACYTNERDAIREYDATTPITTNLMGTFKDLDYFEWAKEMDVVSWDNYPGMDTPPSFTAMCHDLIARHRRQQAVHADGADPEPAELVPVLQGQAAGGSA